VLHPPRMTRDTRYVGISLSELTDCVEPHAALEVRQVTPFRECHKGALYRRERGARPFQLHVDGVDTLCDVHLQGFQEQRPLVTEGVVHALSPDAHDARQLISGCSGETLLRKKPYGSSQGFILIELSRSSHVSSYLLLGDISTVDRQVCASDEACLVGCQVGHEAGDFRYIPHPLQRDERF
jgi:hypothetical protein